jgi:nucleotide-binding universal stress UspA family protein
VLGRNMSADREPLPSDLATAHAMILAERDARQRAEALVSAAALEIERLKLLLARMRRERFGQSSERGARLIEQLELQLAKLEEAVAEEEATAEIAAPSPERAERSSRTRKPARRPLPDNLPRERIVYPAPCACPKCGGPVRKLGEDVTESLECEPRRWKVVEHVREKVSCRACEAISQPPAPSHPIARGRAGPSLLALVLVALLCGSPVLLGDRSTPLGQLLEADHLGLIGLEQPLVGPCQAVEPGLQLPPDRLLLGAPVRRLGDEPLELGDQLLRFAEQADDVAPHRPLDHLGIDHRPRALGVAPGRQRIDTGAAVVETLEPAGRPSEAAAVDGEPTDAALQQAAQEVVMLLVVAERHQGVARHLRLGAIPRLLVHERWHRDRDPLIMRPGASAGFLLATR